MQHVNVNMNRSHVIAPILVVLTLLLAFGPMFDYPAMPMDEGTLVVYPELVAQGQLPYRDFETFYGPANLWVLSAAFSLFGTSITVERTVGLLYRIVILVAIFGIARRWGTALAAGAMGIAGALLLPLHLPAFAWMGALACALTSLWIGGTSHRAASLSGLFAGLTLLFRPDVGPAVLLGALPFLYEMSWRRRLCYCGGMGLGLLPLAWLTVLAGPAQVFNNLFLFPVVHCNPGRRLPLGSIEPSLLILLAFHFFACITNVTAGVRIFRKAGGDANRGLLLAIALFSAGLSFQATQRLDIIHFLFVGFLSIALLPVSLAVIIKGKDDAPPSFAPPMLAVVSVIAVVATLTPETTILIRDAFLGAFTTSTGRSVVLVNGDRAFPARLGPWTRPTMDMFDKLQVLAKPGERLFVGPADLRRTNCNDTFIYHLFPQLRPATYFLEMNPFSANRPGSRLAADVQSADWLILNRYWDTWQEPNRSTEYGASAPNDIVREEFDLKGEYATYLLYRRRTAALPSGQLEN